MLGRREALQAAFQRRGRRRTNTAAHGAFLRLHLYIKTEIDHGILGLRDIATFVTSHGAS